MSMSFRCLIKVIARVCIYIHTQMLLSHVEPLTEQQIVGVYGLQQSALEMEEALSQGLEALYQSLLQAMRSESKVSCILI